MGQRARELAQWMDHGGKTRRGYYLAVKLKAMVDGRGNDIHNVCESADETLSRFIRGYTSLRAAMAIFDGEFIDVQEQYRIQPADRCPVAPNTPSFAGYRSPISHD